MLDFNSHAWHALRTWAQGELNKAKDKNDAVSLSDLETAALRGEIRVLKRFLDLPHQATRNVVVDLEI